MKQSAGILLYRITKKKLEVLLVHPGGPFWKNKDEGAWSIPKGEFEKEEDPLKAAIREFKEETGFALSGEFIPLNPIKQKSGKQVRAWAVEGDIDVAKISSNEFELEWPPKSGKRISVPEIDKAGWFDINAGKIKILEAQKALLDELGKILNFRF